MGSLAGSSASSDVLEDLRPPNEVQIVPISLGRGSCVWPRRWFGNGGAVPYAQVWLCFWQLEHTGFSLSHFIRRAWTQHNQFVNPSKSFGAQARNRNVPYISRNLTGLILFNSYLVFSQRRQREALTPRSIFAYSLPRPLFWATGGTHTAWYSSGL